MTNRLLAISRMVIPGQAAADIGSDHAFLPIYLAEHGIVPAVIATEISDGPLIRAQEAIEGTLSRDLIDIRKGDGLQPLQKGEAATVIIAGMGGDTILGILAFDWDKARSFKRFVFQPMSRPDILRAALAEQGWPILDEVLVTENRRIFVILSSKPGKTPYQLSRLELDIGPIILAKKDDELVQLYLKHKMTKYKVVYKNLMQSNFSENRVSIMDYEQRIKELGEIMDAG